MINCDSLDVITLEVTTLGFVSKNVAKFRRLLKYLKVNDNRIIAKCMEVVSFLRCFKVLFITVQRHLVCGSIEPTEKHIQFHHSLHK